MKITLNITKTHKYHISNHKKTSAKLSSQEKNTLPYTSNHKDMWVHTSNHKDMWAQHFRWQEPLHVILQATHLSPQNSLISCCCLLIFLIIFTVSVITASLQNTSHGSLEYSETYVQRGGWAYVCYVTK